jgi:hypothetical protein
MLPMSDVADTQTLRKLTMSQTKRISRRTRAILKKAESPAIVPGATAHCPSLSERARAARVEAVREVISHPEFNLDGAFARAVTKLIEREIG